jgi:MFS family permease
MALATDAPSIRHHLGQLSLLAGVNLLVGATLGQERTVLPLLATDAFAIEATSAVLTFIVAFGAAKALTNLAAGHLMDRFGRKPVLVGGWLIAIPVPLLVIWAPTWAWVVVANVLLGIGQGLTWSATLAMKVDLAGPARRGLAAGLNEAAGYLGVAAAAASTGLLAERFGLRPAPFMFGLVVALIGLLLSGFAVRETHHHVDVFGARAPHGLFQMVTLFDPAMSSATQAGLVNNLNDAVAWGLFPLLFAAGGLPVIAIGGLVALYPAVWGVGQLPTGTLSDRWGRRPFVVGGMTLQAAGLALIAAGSGVTPWATGAILLGMGTAAVYPVLVAVISDVAEPSWRASATGIYRFWRDAGFAAGGLLAGVAADAYGIRWAIGATAALTLGSAIVAGLRLRETLPAPQP